MNVLVIFMLSNILHKSPKTGQKSRAHIINAYELGESAYFLKHKRIYYNFANKKRICVGF